MALPNRTARAVEQSLVAFPALPQLAEEFADGLQLPGLDDPELGELFGVLPVVGKAVVLDRHAVDRLHGIGAADVQGDEAGRVGLQGQMREVEHQLKAGDVIVGVGHVAGRSVVDHGPGSASPFLTADQPLFHVADGGEILIELFPILGARVRD